MEQITLNFDASEFDGFEKIEEYFSHRTRAIRDEQGRAVKQAVQAMEMDYSPSQWSHKINRSNNTSVTLEDADRHTEIFGDVSWIYYAVHKHIIQRGNVDEIEELERRLAEAKARRGAK